MICETAILCLALMLAEITIPPPLHEMPLFLSWYDPALCHDENGGILINCDSDPSVMAGGTAVTPEMYGYAAACIPEWFDRRLTIPGVGERHCLDTGGAVQVTYRRTYTADGFVWGWVIVVDVLAHHETPPSWQYSLVYGWSLQ